MRTHNDTRKKKREGTSDIYKQSNKVLNYFINALNIHKWQMCRKEHNYSDYGIHVAQPNR